MSSPKITGQSPERKDEPLPRSDGCFAACALDLVGERWSLLVLRELLFGPRRFSDLREGLPEISANTLTKRLDALESRSLVQRRRLPPPAASVQVYELTPSGQRSEEVLVALARWAGPFSARPDGAGLSSAGVMLALRAAFVPERANGLDALVALRIGRDDVVARVSKNKLSLARGEAEAADLRIAGSGAAIAALLDSGGTVANPEHGEKVEIEGARWLARLFWALFPQSRTG